MRRIKWMMMIVGVIGITKAFGSIVMMITPTVTTSVMTMMMRCIVWVDAVDHNSSNHNSF